MAEFESVAETDAERLDRARDFFGDPVKRWNDRLVLEGHSYIEEYVRGRLALVLHCNIPVVLFPKPNPAGFVHDVRVNENKIVRVILKANTLKPHKLHHWNEKLMLVPDVHIVNSPEGVIPSLVGFYRIQDKVMNGLGDLLLFQSAIKGTYQFLPRIADWEPCPFVGSAIAPQNNLVVHEIQGAAEIVQNVPNDKRGIIGGEGRYVNPKVICSSLDIFVNTERVEVRARENAQQGIQVSDVFYGPFNLFC
jgi:hypothetical protein